MKTHVDLLLIAILSTVGDVKPGGSLDLPYEYVNADTGFHLHSSSPIIHGSALETHTYNENELGNRKMSKCHKT